MTATHKVLAKSLGAQLGSAGYPLCHSHALHLVAALHNLPTWNALKARPNTPPLTGPAAIRAVRTAFERFTGQVFPANLSLDLGDLSFDPELGEALVWNDDAFALARLLVLRAQSLTSTGLLYAVRTVQQWIRNDAFPFDWRSNAQGLLFLEGVPLGTRVLPEAITLLQADWERVRSHPDVDTLVKQVLPVLCWDKSPLLVKTRRSLHEVAWALVFLTAYRRRPEPEYAVEEEVFSLDLADLPGEHLTGAPAPVLAFLEELDARLLWPQAAALAPFLPPADLRDAQVQGRAHALLQPVELWTDAVPDLLLDLLHVHGPDVLSELLVLELQDPDEAVHVFRARHPQTTHSEMELRSGVRRLRAKLTHPVLRSPWQTTVQMTGSDHGVVLYSPIPGIQWGMPFHEDVLYLVPGAQPREPYSTLSVHQGVLELARIIRQGEEYTLPKHRSGDLVVLGASGSVASLRSGV